MKRAACIALLTIAAFAASALAQKVGGTSGGSAGPVMTGATTNGSAAPSGTTGQAGVSAGPINPATGSNTMPEGNENISNQGLNPSDINGVSNAQSNLPNSVPNSSQSTLPSPASNTFNNNGGFIGGGAVGAPLIGTPSASFGGNVSPSPVGASNATSGLQAGASNSTLMQEPMPMNASGSASSAASQQFAGGFNTGAAEFSSDQGLGGKSLGQIAAENRQKKATQNVRVYTNQDLQRIAQTPTTGFETNGVAGQGANSFMTGAQGNAQQGTTGGTMGAVSGSTATPAQPAAPAVGAPTTPPPAPKNQNNPPPPTIPR